MTPDEEMYVTPANARMPTPLRPSSHPASAPGVALSTASTAADGRWRRKLVANSAMENSSPRVRSSSTTPMDAPVVTNGPAAGTGAMPPLPRARPASRYSGIGDNPYRRAAAPSTVSTVRMTPSSSSSATETCTGSALVDDALDPGDALFGADHHQHVASAQGFRRSRRRQHFVFAHDRHDRRAGAGARASFTEWSVDERAVRPNLDLARVEPGDLSRQVGESFGHPRGAQDQRERLGLLIGEPQDRLGLVGIIAGVHDEFEVAAAPGDDADAFSVFDIELVAQAHPGQQHLFDVHAVNTR